MTGRIELVVKALAAANVCYLIVGGVAVVLHGHLRTTLDLDLVIQLERENLDRALKVFTDLGFEPRVPVLLGAFADAQNREIWSREKNMVVFSLWHPGLAGFAVDLFLEEPFDFEAVYGRAVSVRLEEVTATVLSLDDLIAMKKSAARPQDLLDVDSLLDLGRGNRGTETQ